MTRSQRLQTRQDGGSQRPSQRIGSVYSEETFARQPLYAVSSPTPAARTQRPTHHSTSTRFTANTPHPASQIAPTRALKPQHHHRTTAPTPPQHTTYDSHYHAGPLYVVNPDPPALRRKTFREVCAEQGEPLAKPRTRLVSYHARQVNAERLDLDRKQEVAYDSAATADEAVLVETGSSRKYTVEKQFELVRRGSGVKAKVRRGVLGFFRFRWC